MTLSQGSFADAKYNTLAH